MGLWVFSILMGNFGCRRLIYAVDCFQSKPLNGDSPCVINSCFCSKLSSCATLILSGCKSSRLHRHRPLRLLRRVTASALRRLVPNRCGAWCIAGRASASSAAAPVSTCPWLLCYLPPAPRRSLEVDAPAGAACGAAALDAGGSARCTRRRSGWEPAGQPQRLFDASEQAQRTMPVQASNSCIRSKLGSPQELSLLQKQGIYYAWSLH